MKNVAYSLFIVLYTLLSACQSEPVELQEKNSIPTSIISKLQEAGFNTSEGLRQYKDGYLVEYDIFLTETQIDELVNRVSIGKDKSAKTKHYRTNALVTGTPRVIRVSIDAAFAPFVQNAFDAALSRYNALGLSLSFQKAASLSTADISILPFYEVNGSLGIGGFPFSSGNPYNLIYLNTYWYNSSNQRGDVISVIAHEIGHCIGFRHTDFMNRAFSCSQGGGNEGDGGVGAIIIPGTSAGPSANSWMLACINGIDRPFTAEDIIALRNTYPSNSANNRHVLYPGEQLLQNQGLRSVDGRFTMVLQGDGNLVIYTATGQALWASNTGGNPQITRCIMQTDGNLVLYDNNYTAYWHTSTNQYPGAQLYIQNDGNLVIYQNNVGRWASGSCCY